MMHSIVLLDLQLQHSSLKIKIFIIKNPHCGNNEGESNKFLLGLRFKAIPYVTLGLRPVFATL